MEQFKQLVEKATHTHSEKLTKLLRESTPDRRAKIAKDYKAQNRANFQKELDDLVTFELPHEMEANLEKQANQVIQYAIHEFDKLGDQQENK